MNDPCVIRLPRSRAVRYVGLLALVAVVGMGSVGVWSHRLAAYAVPASAGLARLPLTAQAPVSRALGQDDASYWAQRSAGGLVVVNRAQRLGAPLRQLPLVAPRAVADEALYAHPGVTEWYVNGPLGLEQGFTVAAPPVGRHGAPLTLAVALSGNVRGRMSRGADGIMFTGGGGSLAYRGLVATDARGAALRAWMELRGSDLFLRIAAAGARYPIRVDPFVQQAKLTASDGAEFDSFGTSVAISGDTVVVGAPSVTVGGNREQGAAYVFVKPRSGWADGTQSAKLTASHGAADDLLGQSVAISGDTVVAGAPSSLAAEFPGPEAVYVFVKPASGWVDATDTAKLTASDGATGDNFGLSVAISGDTVVVGAPDATVGFNFEQGAAYVFVKPRSGWADATQTAKLTASDGAAGNLLGQSVAISGEAVVTGAPQATVGGNLFQGAAYVFGVHP